MATFYQRRAKASHDVFLTNESTLISSEMTYRFPPLRSIRVRILSTLSNSLPSFVQYNDGPGSAAISNWMVTVFPSCLMVGLLRNEGARPSSILNWNRKCCMIRNSKIVVRHPLEVYAFDVQLNARCSITFAVLSSDFVKAGIFLRERQDFQKDAMCIAFW